MPSNAMAKEQHSNKQMSLGFFTYLSPFIFKVRRKSVAMSMHRHQILILQYKLVYYCYQCITKTETIIHIIGIKHICCFILKFPNISFCLNLV